MATEHISDDKIYLYAINPQKVDINERTIIEEHLKGCEECKGFLSEAVKLIKSFETTEPIKISKMEFFEKISYLMYEPGINIIELHEQSFFHKGSRNVVKLAALQHSEVQDRYKYVNTFASAQSFVLMRVMYNEALKKYQLYLICEDMERVKNAVVNFRGLNNDFVANENGIIDLNSDFIKVDLSIQVHLPVGRFEIVPVDIKEEFKIESLLKHFDVILNAEIEKEKLNLKFEYNDDIFSEKLKAYLIPVGDHNNFSSLELGIDKTCTFNITNGFDEKYVIVLVEENN